MLLRDTTPAAWWPPARRTTRSIRAGGEEAFILGDDAVDDELEQFDGDRTADFGRRDRLEVTQAAPAALQVTVQRKRGAPTSTPEPDATPANASIAAGTPPDKRAFLGDASLSANRGWLLGETELSLAAGGLGARVGYAPTTQGAA